MKENNHDWHKSQYMHGKPIEPVHWKFKSTIEDIIDNFERTGLEARNISAGAKLFKKMIDKNDTIWLGISGIGIVEGLGGYVIDLMKAGFVDAICSTGAQVYHDAHFAFGLPIVQGSPNVDDNLLDGDGTTRIYDTNIRLKETLIEQDKIIKEFAKELAKKLNGKIISSADYNYELGKYLMGNSPYPEKSFIASAAKEGVPVFWDSEGNHSIGMNNAALYLDKINADPSPSRSLLEAAAINYYNPQLGFFELGGGGPKNWIQQISLMISQILGIEFEGADRGIQITTANERDGGLSGCTFSEGVTWGKYKDAKKGLVQIWGEYSFIAPLLIGYVLENCQPRNLKRLFNIKDTLYERMKAELIEKQADSVR